MQTHPSTRAVLAALAALLALAVPSVAAAADGHGNGRDDTIDVGADAGKKGRLKLDRKASQPAAPAVTAAAATAAAALESPPLGTQKLFPVINFVTGGARIELFTLRSVGDHSEIWVSNTLNYPTAGDCRNDGSRNVVTTAQTDYLRDEFDRNMYPKESAAFSTPPSRDGTTATLPGLVGLPADYYKGPGDKIVTLVANFRDENFTDITFPSYVAGYHSSGINAFVDRNVMSIDSFDWVHRTGANPPNEPSTVLCENKPAQPFKYEAVFAHEYQHLLEFWASPGESTWANEGLADYAITVTGYGFPARTIEEVGWEGHIQTFLGWRLVQTPANQIPQPNGGPENSLTLWDDQGGLETLSDYGAVWTFMEFLHERYGAAFMTDLHNEDANGLPGLQAVLDRYLTGTTAQALIHEWAAMVALDASLDDGAQLRGAPRRADYQVDNLHASIYWPNPQAYSTHGAPPNGSDYVLLRDAAGSPLTAAQIRTLSFTGARRHDLLPITWQVDANPPAQPGNPALSSPAANNLDRVILREVAVPAGSPSLTFRTRYSLEDQWDYFMVQVSSDGGAHWTSLANGNTTTSHDPGARGAIVAQLPGFTGDADWHTETFSLAAYAGRTVLVAFRNMTDTNTLGNGGAIGAGLWVDDIAVAGTPVSDGSTLDGWRSEVAAPAIAGFTVQLVGLSSTGAYSSILSQVLSGGYDTSLSGGALRRLIGDEVDTVGAIVTYDEPTEAIARYAPYELRVNGVLQPGG
ncbi:MAG: choice-of-anchor J domain-containing protein [Pseudomonadota bacterium]